MNWIDIRVRKPTRDDGDRRGEVIAIRPDGSTSSEDWHSLGNAIAWMPHSALPKFTPAPDPPKPTYRPFKDGEEYAPHFDKPVKSQGSDGAARVVMFYQHGLCIGGNTVVFSYPDAYKQFEFIDGTPFGVNVEAGE